MQRRGVRLLLLLALVAGLGTAAVVAGRSEQAAWDASASVRDLDHRISTAIETLATLRTSHQALVAEGQNPTWWRAWAAQSLQTLTTTVAALKEGTTDPIALSNLDQAATAVEAIGRVHRDVLRHVDAGDAAGASALVFDDGLRSANLLAHRLAAARVAVHVAADRSLADRRRWQATVLGAGAMWALLVGALLVVRGRDRGVTAHADSMRSSRGIDADVFRTPTTDAGMGDASDAPLHATAGAATIGRPASGDPDRMTSGRHSVVVDRAGDARLDPSPSGAASGSSGSDGSGAAAPRWAWATAEEDHPTDASAVASAAEPSAGGTAGQDSASPAGLSGMPVRDRRKAPELRAAADLCTEFGRLNDAQELPALLERAARLIDATGIIVWLADGEGRELRPALAHGYPPHALSRLPAIPRAADNATAAAFRNAEIQIVQTNGMSPGAIVVPVLTSAGCVGVMAAEVRLGREASESARALARILAAQLSTIVAPAPVAQEQPVAESSPQTAAR